jgi:DNA polymerase III subunit epsilon
MPTRHRRQRAEVVNQAIALLERAPVYLDTETTGMDKFAEVVDLAVLDSDGTPLINTLLKPDKPIPMAAQRIHGIDNDSVADAPRLAEVWAELDAILQHRPVVIYNSAFDLRLLAQSAQRQGIFPRQPREVYCAMLMYAEFHGVWNAERESFVWQRLGEALQQCKIQLPDGMRLHRAATDCEATRLLLAHMAAHKKNKPAE